MIKPLTFDQSENVWDVVAEHFSIHGPDYWQRFGQSMVENSQIKSGDDVLDIGFGRGASLKPALEKVGKKGSVTGLEASEAMVFFTEEKILETHCKLIHQDLKTFDSKQTFDVIYNGFGLGYLLEEGIFDKLYHLLKDDGQLSLTTWTHQKNQEWLTTLVNRHLNIKETQDRNPLSTEEGLFHLFEKLPFKGVKIKTIQHQVVYKDKEAWWFEMNHCAVRNILKAINEVGSLETFKSEAFKILEEYETTRGYEFTREAMILTCQK